MGLVAFPTAGSESVDGEPFEALASDSGDQLKVLVDMQNGEFGKFCGGCDE